MLTVARPVHGLQTAAIGTSTVVCPKSVEVGGADKETDAVAGTKHIAGIVFEIGTDDVVFLWCLTIIAVHVNVTDTGLSIALCGYIHIGARVLCRSKKQTGGMVLVAEHKATDILPTYRCLSFTRSE